MIGFFRRIFSSKIGLAITIGFVGLIALAFASADVSGTGTFGGISGSDSVAVVGDAKIGNAEFSRTVGSAVDQLRQNSPTLTMRAFVEQDGLEDVLDRLVERYTLAEYARKYGMRAGDNLVNSQIMQIPAFRGADGNFSQVAYEGALRQQGLSDALVRQDLSQGLLSEQITLAAIRGARLPNKFAVRYGALLGERRKGTIAFIPSAAFAPKKDPSDAQLKEFYDANRADYIRPERRTVRFTTFSMDNVDARTDPTDAEIAARYKRDKAQYEASESRGFTRLIVPTQDAANAIKSRVESGEAFSDVAKELGFGTSAIEPTTKSAYTSSTNTAVANAAFAAQRGKIAEPVRGPLGWHVVRVDSIETRAARSLAQVTPQLRETLKGELQITALADLSAQIEDRVDDGAPLSEVAKDLGVEVTTTQQLTADGRVYQKPQETAPAELAAALETAFQMDEGEPQLAEIVRGQTYLVFEVGEITPSATAPMEEIKAALSAAWKLDSGSKLAKEASERILKRVSDGSTLAAAVSAEKTRLPPAENVNLNRREIVSQNRQVPPPLALLFSMATDTTKRLEIARNLGWFVVDLDTITADSLDENSELIAATSQQLQGALVGEYSQQLTAAMSEEVGVKRNEDAIAAVRKQLLGES